MEKKIVSLVAVAITGCATPNNNSTKGNDKSFHKFLESKGFKEKTEVTHKSTVPKMNTTDLFYI